VTFVRVAGSLEFSIERDAALNRDVANYNRPMDFTVANVDVASLARANAPDDALRLVPVGSEAWDYCRELARLNMTPYLVKRGQTWSDGAWNKHAASREMFQLFVARERVGFISIWPDSDNNSVHIGDLQLEAQHIGRGIGTRAIEKIFAIAKSRDLREVTLNVFRDNPAAKLYERLGFQIIDHGFDKLKMRCALRAQRAQDDASL
jgi:ribosomal protein S18 acetylase RimI-like enzyme